MQAHNKIRLFNIGVLFFGIIIALWHIINFTYFIRPFDNCTVTDIVTFNTCFYNSKIVNMSRSFHGFTNSQNITYYRRPASSTVRGHYILAKSELEATSMCSSNTFSYKLGDTIKCAVDNYDKYIYINEHIVLSYIVPFISNIYVDTFLQIILLIILIPTYITTIIGALIALYIIIERCEFYIYDRIFNYKNKNN